jgi:hypothetical protein
MNLKLLTLACALALSGCASRQVIQFDYQPETKEMSRLASTTFSLDVTDQRHYVTSGPKLPSYLGHSKDVIGAVHSYKNDGGIALAEQVKNDLRRELQSLGLAEHTSAPAVLIIMRIYDWNFDAGVSGRFWYDVQLTVADAGGQTVANIVVKDRKQIEGGFADYARHYIQQDIPEFYDEFIRKLVRENPSMLAALERASGR